MFLRPYFRRRNGQREAFWALVESYRTERGPRQRTVAYLGLMDEAGRLGVEQAVDPQPALSQRERLFAEDNTAPAVRRDRPHASAGRELPAVRWSVVGLGTRQATRATPVPAALDAHGTGTGSLVADSARSWSSRGSASRRASSISPNTFTGRAALADLLGVSADRVDDNRLYRGLDELLPHKPAAEAFLKQRFGELFAIEYDLLLYDVTSTYFEGQADANPLAKRGYSARDHRSDCKQVCIGLVVTRAAACRWAMKCSPETGTTRRRWRKSSTPWKPATARRKRRLGIGSRDGFARQPRLPQGRRAAVHRGHAQEPTSAV